MEFFYLIFYACLRLRFLDVETHPDPQRSVPDVCRVTCSNVLDLAGNVSELTLSQYDMLLCFETLVSDKRLWFQMRLSELLFP